MNREQIIQMAREAQMPFYWQSGEITYLDKLEHFAYLVAEHERERIKQANAPEIERVNSYIKELEDAVKVEREQCIVDIRWSIPRAGRHTPEYQMAMRMIERIKARGQA